MTRHGFFQLALALLLVSLATSVTGKRAERLPVIGLLMVSSPPDDPIIVALRKQLRGLGYVDGKNVRIEYRGAGGRVELLPRLAEDLVRLNADVIVTASEASLRAAKQATDRIPIVMVSFDYDPVARGLINSLSSPGGNITGIYARQTETVGKRLELLKELLPQVKRFAVFWDSSSKGQLEETKRAAQMLGIEPYFVELHPPYDFRAAVTAATKTRVKALMILYSPVFYAASDKIAALANEHHLPTIFQWKAGPLAGGLISYGVDDTETYGHAAYFIDRLLKGAKPSELPVEQQAVLALVVNMRTAKQLGVNVPESVLLRANEVIR